MELQGSRRRREVSPNRAKVCLQSSMKMFRKVQVVYYLSRNGQLEHPHFMEVSHLAGQDLRLKDVIDRLSVLRGRGMPSLYSWSCKRSYRNGYVWKDLAEEDLIFPAEGSEYVLKGSEIIEGCSDRFQQLHVSNGRQNAEIVYHSKRIINLRRDIEVEEDGVHDDDERDAMAKLRTRNGRHHRRSDEKTHHPTVLTLDDTPSPPSTSSTPSDKALQPAGRSQRFTDAAPDPTPAPSRSSVLLTLLACGTASARRNPSPAGEMVGSRSGLSSVVVKRVVEEEEEIRCMSENPRFGNLPAVEKEYFSGSIVETAGNDHRLQSSLKRSASYNEERSKKDVMGEEDDEEVKDMGEGCSGSLAGKCIPMRAPAKHQQQPKK